MQNRYIIQLRTDPAFDVIDTTTGLVVSVWNTECAAEIDAAFRLVDDLRNTRRAATEQRKGRANTQDAVAQLENDFEGLMNHIYNSPR
jgi:hypothetical protein